MPPLVDNPYPSMTFTFSAEMTPITYSTDPTGFEVVPETGDDQFSPPTSPSLGPIRGSHSKKRDASYIPRPPNAFILFRSSFIRAQHIPGKIEGNHSALSKIIGKYWKALPREEKEVWEAKAIVAQAEHRKKYPDWRFRPGANALAKVKDGPRKRTNRKGRGEAEKEERSRDNRCAKIADLLVAGKKGADLEVAIEEYDYKHNSETNVKKESGGLVLVQFEGGVKPSVATPAPAPAQRSIPAPQPTTADAAPRKLSRSLSPDAAHDLRFKTPLTAMFKRSSSAPAPRTRTDAGEQALASPGPQTTPSPIVAHVVEPRAGNDSDITDAVSSTRLLHVKLPAPTQSAPDSNPAVANFSPPGGTPAQNLWPQTFITTYSDIDTYSPSVQSFDSDLESNASPVQSPLAYTFDIAGDPDSAGSLAFNANASPHPSSGNAGFSNLQSSYSSLKGWADDAALKRHHSFNYGPAPSFLSGHPSPMVYDPDSVMKDAFAAASSAAYEDWGVAFTSSDSYRFTSARDIQSLQLYAQGWQQFARRQDDGSRLLC
ncbi:hypothetical protein BXZ70DRAFT_585957 [Cristinia sonorae]|uniref:HMG box domain-containing protein n=1 Tax=Cristinia sonorae TaxID=1940300 RepID=A0A8K0UEN1_9AGAR|nr:hypothetical protein BXZ70DRAFT_585957 [Cristinia sonorae]